MWDVVGELIEPEDYKWFAVRTAPRHEKRVHERLLGRGVESFLPLWERWSRWKDRRKLVQLPLFSGYCFAHFAIHDRLEVITTLGVRGIVGSNRGPEPVEDAEIESLRTLIRSSLRFDPCPSIKIGMRVEVVRGPLMGVQGLLIRKDSKDRLVLSVDLIRQGAAV